MTMDRRGFVASAAAALAASCMRVRPEGAAVPAPGGGVVAASASRLPIGFSTLGSPGWDWIRTLDFAAEHGFAAVELRGLRETMDLSKLAEFQPDRIAQSRQQLRDRKLVVACLGASVTLHEQDAAKRATAMAETRRFIDVASALGTPYVRVFGDRFVPGLSREDSLAYVARGLRELGEYALPRKVTVLLESHGEFVDSPTLLALMKLANHPGVALLWDAHHTFVAGESTETSVRELGPYIRHTHLKDSVPAGASGRTYVLSGSGEVPMRRQIEALARIGYSGYYSFEWEKRWHPEIEEPEIAIAQYARVVSGYLRDAGVKSGARVGQR
jgi:sugar phosphate isomerase/epimerase